ncbi:MAG: hypothetical protein CMN56_12285 [Sneathiella sp.]|nr:hypothetical protein [Sneathiella sp.]
MSHKSKHKHSEDEQISPSNKPQEMLWIAPERNIDPVCGTQVITNKAKSAVHNGSAYYPCSRECREIFEVGSETYLGIENLQILSYGSGPTYAWLSRRKYF